MNFVNVKLWTEISAAMISMDLGFYSNKLANPYHMAYPTLYPDPYPKA